VVGQDDHGIDQKRDFPPHATEHVAECVNMRYQHFLPAVAQVQRKEIRAACDAVAVIGGHGVYYPVIRCAPYGLHLLARAGDWGTLASNGLQRVDS
jgi:hypothetical protein